MRHAILAALLSMSGTAWAQEDPPPVPQERIERLIRELGSSEFETRERATTELKKIGRLAADALRKAAENAEDPEVRARASAILEALTRPEPKKDEPARPGAPALRGASVSVVSQNGDTRYTITPAGGRPFTFHRNADGSVKLETSDDGGKEQVASSDSLDAFLKDHAELAAKHGITKDGIETGGARVGFGGGAFRIIRPFRLPPFDPQDESDEEWWPDGDLEELLDRFGAGPMFVRPTVHGARFGSVSDVLRSHLKLPETGGLVVERVRAGSLAEQVGLRTHDIVLEVDGQAVKTAADVRKLLKKESKIGVVRAGERRKLGE